MQLKNFKEDLWVQFVLRQNVSFKLSRMQIDQNQIPALKPPLDINIKAISLVRMTGVSRYLDLLDVVNNEHVLQVLHGSLHPVVERRCSLGVLQVELIYRLQLLLCSLSVKERRRQVRVKMAQ